MVLLKGRLRLALNARRQTVWAPSGAVLEDPGTGVPVIGSVSADTLTPSRINLVAELRELAHLHREGLLSLAEFESAKQRLLGSC